MPEQFEFDKLPPSGPRLRLERDGAAGPRGATSDRQPPAAVEEGREVHLLDYVRVLYKRRWAAISAFLTVFLSVIVYTFTATPIYQSRVRLLIEPEGRNI